MLTVEQIKLLENRVLKAVDKISSLQDENLRLREGLSRYERRIEELEVLIQEFREGQQAIEDGILSALKRLDILEDEIASDEAPVEAPPDSPQAEALSRKSEKPAASAQPDSPPVQDAAAPDSGDEIEITEPQAETQAAETEDETESESELDIF